jgi:[amino group carrier protein]-lysine/ornithine hydrolase
MNARGISQTEAVGLLRGMLEIPSPSHREMALGRYLARSMRTLGFTSDFDMAGNVIGEIGSADRPTVMLLSHMDTCPGDLPVRSADGRLYGRGAASAKGPLAAMICAASGAAGFPGKVVVIGVVEKETPYPRGAMTIRAACDCPDALIIGEPTGWSNVVLGYSGRMRLRYSVRCRRDHPGSLLPTATELAVGCFNAATELLRPQADRDSFDQPSARLVPIREGRTFVDAELSIRTPPGFDRETFVSQLRARLTAGDLTVVDAVTACRTSEDDPVVRVLGKGIRQHHGEPVMKVEAATSDMNRLAEAWSVPMASYGPGDSAVSHTDDEHVLLADYLQTIAVLRTALAEFKVIFPLTWDFTQRNYPASRRSR